MLWLTDSFEAIRDFMELGGPVLRWIALTIFLMWVLIVERIMFFRTSMKAMAREIHDDWESRPERRSWNAHQIRELMISRFSMTTHKGIALIQTLVALCPLLGLLGTVTGMISVFQVMAVSGCRRRPCRRWREWLGPCQGFCSSRFSAAARLAKSGSSRTR
jgi:biopolymer transport protein ExbB